MLRLLYKPIMSAELSFHLPIKGRVKGEAFSFFRRKPRVEDSEKEKPIPTHIIMQAERIATLVAMEDTLQALEEDIAELRKNTPSR